MDNPLIWIAIIAAIAVVGSMLGLLFSRSSAPSEPEEPEKYRITLHLGGGETRVYEVDNYDYGDGELILYVGDDKQIVVSGTYTAERIRPQAGVSLSKGTATPPADAVYKFTLYENGAAVKQYFLTDYSAESTEVTLNVVGSDDEVIADGCYVVEPITLSPASDVHYAQTGDDDDRFKVQLFQAGRVMREIMASSYESANGSVTIYPVDCEDAVIFRGTFVVEQV